jgi:hypothetical protein
MSVRFAAAGSGECLVVARVLCAPRLVEPANDADTGPGRDQLLRAALRHFAAHGLGAAEHARAEGERAFFAGDREAYHHWMSICRALDRRLADSARRQRKPTRAR